MNSRVNLTRILYKGGDTGPGPVVYWMSRDQRVRDNWALLYAQETALEKKSPLLVTFCLATPNFLKASSRMYDFMLPGLEEVQAALARLQIPFIFLTGDPVEEISAFLKRVKAGALVTDFNPLKISLEWKEKVRKKTKLAYFVVDAHNIVPCWAASPKLEFGAYTIRSKINKLLPEFLEDFPKLKIHPFPWKEKPAAPNFPVDRKMLSLDSTPAKADWIQPGEKAAAKALDQFIQRRLSNYDEGRNEPSGSGQSDLSPYFHFGQLSPQRAGLEAEKIKVPEQSIHSKVSDPSVRPRGLTPDYGTFETSREAFLEELIIRRELSDNYCYYNKNYDNFEGFPDWAKLTLNAHRKDKRPYLYSKEQLEKAITHDPYWNAAQLQMVYSGKMHGYMRMYWAKKILEWTKSPEEAQAVAIELNDRYELDGRDPNGYTGIAWSLGGVHDRAWRERPIFGKIRYMNAAGLERKFEMARYAGQWDNAQLL